jgi:hypothetical protein
VGADDRRLANLRATLGFLQLKPTEPELQMLHRWLDNWPATSGREAERRARVMSTA